MREFTLTLYNSTGVSCSRNRALEYKGLDLIVYLETWSLRRESNPYLLVRSEWYYPLYYREKYLAGLARIELTLTVSKTVVISISLKTQIEFVKVVAPGIATIHPCNKLERDSVRHLGYRSSMCAF